MSKTEVFAELNSAMELGVILPDPTNDDLMEFCDAYLTCGLWSTHNEQTDSPFDDDYTSDDFSNITLSKIYDECREFMRMGMWVAGPVWDNVAAGHDFWLTRNGHGSGFWDGDWPETSGNKLSDIADSFGGCDLYLTDDNQLDID